MQRRLSRRAGWTLAIVAGLGMWYGAAKLAVFVAHLIVSFS